MLQHRTHGHAPRARRTARCQSGRGGTTTSDARRSCEIVGRRGFGRDLAVHLLDRFGIEGADRAEVDGEPAPQRDRVGAPVLELLVVEERVGPGGEDLVREHRRLGGVGEVHGDRRPTSGARAASRVPSTSSASCSVSPTVWRTSTWSGISIGPVTFSWHAAACGNTAAMRSSDSMRWIGGGLRRPLRKRSTMSERLRFQRHRAWNMGESRMACCERVLDRRAAEVAGHLRQRSSPISTRPAPRRSQHRSAARPIAAT